MILRRSIDFLDFDFYNFPIFQDILDADTIHNRVVLAVSPFQIPEPFPRILADNIYDYCFGKMCNLVNGERWERNFLGEISTYILEQGRYLQAYVRDVNQNIDKDGTSKTVSTGQEISGNVNTRKNGNVENTQTSEVAGSNQQQGVHELGDTLTTLNNQTTSTLYLASVNEEAYSRGSVTETGASSFGKEDSTSISLGMENGASLTDTKDENTVETEGTKSPLDIAIAESSFNFHEWMEPLFAIIDSYFTPGGSAYA